MGTWAVTGSPLGCDMMQQYVSFVRASHTPNSAGELVASFVSTITVLADLTPEPGLYPRFLQGTLVEVNYSATVFGHPDIRVGDRTLLSAAPLEVVNVQQFGEEQADLSLRWVR